MSNDLKIRLIDLADAKATLAVYTPYILHTSITFEYDVPTITEFEARITANTVDYPWFVCELDGQIIGYAYGSRHRYRTAYGWSVETAIYLDENFHSKGIARLLYEALFETLALQGYYNLYAGVAVPNIKSEKFHKSMGFEEIGVFSKIGYKFGQWHDVKWYQLFLNKHIINPTTPKLLAEIKNTNEIHTILEKINSKLNN